MSTIGPLASGEPTGGYHITLHGPISPFVKPTIFSFTHRNDGRRALLEIVGFWHPDSVDPNFGS